MTSPASADLGRADEEHLITEAALVLASALDTEAVFPEFARSVAALIPFDRLSLGLLDSERDSLTTISSYGAELEPELRVAASRARRSCRGLIFTDRRSAIFSAQSLREAAQTESEGLAAFKSGLTVSLNPTGGPIGVLTFLSFTEHAYQATHASLAERLAAHATPAVANARRYIAAQRTAAEGQAIAEIGRMVMQAEDVFSVLETASGAFNRLIPFDRLSVSMIDAESSTMGLTFVRGVRVRGLEQGAVLPLEDENDAFESLNGPARQVIRKPFAKPIDEALMEAGLRACLRVPLKVRDMLIGVIEIHSADADSYSESDGHLLERVAAQIAPALENARLYSNMQREAAERATLADIGRTLSSAVDAGEVYERFAEQLKLLLAFDRLAIRLVSPDHESLLMEYVSGTGIRGWETGSVHPTRCTATARIIKDKSGAVNHEAQVRDQGRKMPSMRDALAAGLRSHLEVPLVSGDEPIGTLEAWSSDPSAYGSRHLALAEQVAAQIAGAIANSQLHKALQREADERRSLAEIALLANSDLNLEKIYERVADELTRLLPYDRLVFTRAPAGQSDLEIAYVRGVPVDGAAVGDTMPPNTADALDNAGWLRVIRRGKADERSSGRRFAAAGLKSWIQVSLGPSPRASGHLSLRSLQEDTYSERDLDLLERVAAQIAPAIENARLYDAVQRDAEERHVLAEIGRIINSSLDINTVYEGFAGQVERLVPFDRLVITTVDDELGVLSDAYTTGVRRSSELRETRPIEGSSLAPVIERRASLIIRGALDGDEAALRCTLAVPLISNNKVIGTLNLQARAADAYKNGQIALAERVGAQIAGAIANSQLYAQALQLGKEKEMRARLDAENLELHRSNEAKSRFLSTVSHELKTPLTSIVAFTDILSRNRSGNLTERQMQHLEVMRRNGERLDLLISDLLDLSRLESGAFELTMSEFDACEALNEIAQSLSPIFKSKGQAVKRRLPRRPLWVSADRDRLTQVVSNLLTNASKYSPANTQVELEAQGRGGRLCVSIRDQGIGIADSDKKKLFTAFFRADNVETRSVTGTGLGLAISKSIIGLHNGKIMVESKPGVGSTFRFEIPGLIEQSDSVHTSRAGPDGQGTGPNAGQSRKGRDDPQSARAA